MDKVTILKHTTNLLAKTWLADGSIKPYDEPKQFVWTEQAVEGIGQLSELLTRLEGNAKACVIRGEYLGDAVAGDIEPEFKVGRVLRRKSLFRDVPRHWMLVEVDEFQPLSADPVTMPVEAIEEFISTEMPACFMGASYHWQLSNSAGSEKNAGILKAHVWFWLDTPYTSEVLRGWARALNLPIDKAVFDTIQVHYTSAPVFEDGIADPVPVRSGFVEGFLSDSVALVIDEAVIAQAGGANSKPNRRQVLQGAVSADRVAQRLHELDMVKSMGKNGELNIQCPRSEHHTQDSAETATIYYPAHTGGYEKGAFVCLHAHCKDTPQSIFKAAIGIDEIAEQFDDVTEADGTRIKSTIKIPGARHLTTDQANANRMFKHYGHKLIAVGDAWYAWVGSHWAPDEAAVYRFALTLSAIIHKEADEYKAKPYKNADEKEKNQAIAEALEKWAKRSEMKGTVDAAMALAKRMLTVKPEEIDANPWLLNCANGTVDLRTGHIKPHDHTDYITRLIPLNYYPNAKSELFEKTLSRVTCEENLAKKPLARFLQRWFGYCATGSTREQKFAVHHGSGRNGKSTILDLLADVLGEYAATAAPDLMMGSNDRHPTEIADLRGRRMVTAHETGEGGLLREDFVKQATGSDKLKARYMRQDFFEFLPTHKLQLLTNHKPTIKGQDEGIWRRVMLIPYKAKFGSVEEVAEGKATYVRDTRIAEHLNDEKEGVLAWIVAGAVEWHRDGLNPPDAVLAASKEYQSEQDRIMQFIHEECELHPEHSEKLTAPFGGGLYPAYTTWCKASGIFALQKNRFLQELERCVPFFANRTEKAVGENGKRRNFAKIYGLRLIDSETAN